MNTTQHTPKVALIQQAGEDVADWAARQPKIGPANDRRVSEYLETGIWLQDNARLIAAAPELLEAAEAFLRYMDANGGAGSYTQHGKVRDAIAKAKGNL